MGSGYKDFAPGDVLTAADVDGYLMRQTVMTFADASARDTALSGVLDEGMMAFLEDTDRLTYYTGSAWVDVSNASSAGVYEAYTPSFTGISFSSYTARYTRLNDMVHVYVTGILNAAVTTTIAVTLPVTANLSSSDLTRYGACAAVDIGTSQYREGRLELVGTFVRFYGFDSVGTANRWDDAYPFTWASGDYFSFELTYEAA